MSTKTLRVRPPDLCRYTGALRRLTIHLGGIKLRLASYIQLVAYSYYSICSNFKSRISRNCT